MEQEMSLLNVVRESGRVCLRHARELLLLLAVTVLLLTGLMYKMTPENAAAIQPSMDLSTALLMLIVFVVSGMVWLTVTVRIGAALQGDALCLSAALKKACLKLPALIGSGLLAALIVSLGMLLLLIPGIIYAIYYLFVNYAVIFRDKSGMGALRYSKALVKGRWWRVFGRIVAISMGTALLMMIPATIISVAIAFMMPPGGSLIWLMGLQAISMSFNTLASTFSLIAAIVMFLNLDACTPEDAKK